MEPVGVTVVTCTVVWCYPSEMLLHVGYFRPPGDASAAVSPTAYCMSDHLTPASDLWPSPYRDSNLTHPYHPVVTEHTSQPNCTSGAHALSCVYNSRTKYPSMVLAPPPDLFVSHVTLLLPDLDNVTYFLLLVMTGASLVPDFTLLDNFIFLHECADSPDMRVGLVPVDKTLHDVIAPDGILFSPTILAVDSNPRHPLVFTSLAAHKSREEKAGLWFRL
ncbi:uncharacterized protein LOC131943491 [Physella acuta]|uniref:uncharacterized protein LOC131943491 n=1 Tax=Physella acuta TaxID=109671 RepID=UPI0027DD76ED|nr:uncharacterized protein LOC131943491 [Physella acuta]